MVQFRDKTVEAAEELELFQVLRTSAERNDKLGAVNDRADITTVAQAPVFHIGHTDLPLASARQLVGKKTMISLSTHTPEQVNKAVTDLRLDYFCVGPVWETPTKPGRAAVGPELVTYAANQVRVKNSAHTCHHWTRKRGHVLVSV